MAPVKHVVPIYIIFVFRVLHRRSLHLLQFGLMDSEQSFLTSSRRKCCQRQSFCRQFDIASEWRVTVNQPACTVHPLSCSLYV